MDNYEDEQFNNDATDDNPLQGFVNVVILMLFPAAIVLFCWSIW